MNDIKVMNHAADNIRILAAAMVEKAKSGHPGGAMGGADFVNVLYAEYLQFDPENPTWEGRDRFFLDPGHMSPMLYGQLALTGKFTLDELQQFRQWGSPTPGHPEVDFTRGVENSSGPLGQGHVYAVGAAIAAKFLATRTGNPTFAKETIYAYISDGGIQEEISQGAGRVAGHLGLDNLIMFYDANDIQLSTETKDITTEDTAMKYRSWGWYVMEIDGNDCQQIREALDAAKKEDKRPTLIIGKCIMGKGARQADNSSYENTCKTHGAPLGAEACKNTIINLGGDPENPFVIFDDGEMIYKNEGVISSSIDKSVYCGTYSANAGFGSMNYPMIILNDETSVEYVENLNINMYVNNTTLFIEGEFTSVEIYSTLGALVGTYNANEINLTNMNHGVYVVRILNGNLAITKKINL